MIVSVLVLVSVFVFGFGLVLRLRFGLSRVLSWRRPCAVCRMTRAVQWAEGSRAHLGVCRTCTEDSEGSRARLGVGWVLGLGQGLGLGFERTCLELGVARNGCG